MVENPQPPHAFITSVTDHVLRAGVGLGANCSFYVKYAIDGLNRVTQADEGTFSGGAGGRISNRTRQENWVLDQVGNWDLNQLDLDGDLNFNEAGELNDDRTHNVVNEITARDTDDNGTNNFSLTYDAVGILSSLASTCRRRTINPQRYFTQLLINLPATPLSQLERWLPDEWKRRDTPPPKA